MPITYFKRFRMEVSLGPGSVEEATLPAGHRLVPWRDELIDRHAETKYRCFVDELDSQVFPCLGDRIGCRRLMREIRNKPGFLPEATWLIEGPEGDCATIQGVIDRGLIGAIQNVGVVPGSRGLGLGKALVRRCLAGFIAAGLPRAFLEVTADNSPAVQLYRKVGFRRVQTLYKAVDGPL